MNVSGVKNTNIMEHLFTFGISCKTRNKQIALTYMHTC